MNLKKLGQFSLLILLVTGTIGLSAPGLFDERGSSVIPQAQPPTPRAASRSSDDDRVWGKTGATVLPIAAQIIAMRNQGGVQLTVAQKGYLRPLFGDLVDRVLVVYGASLLDRWSQGDRETHIGEIDSSAQTYCDRIYVRAPRKPDDTDQLVLLAHELTHSKQCADLGSIDRFGFSYFQGYDRGGQTYQDNPLEKSARSMELKFTQQLCRRIACPPSTGRYYVNYKGWGVNLPVKLSRIGRG